MLEPVKTIANVVIDVAFPTFARLRNDRAALVEQFIKFTRLNLIAVLPFVVLILLVIPEFLPHVLQRQVDWTRPSSRCAATRRASCAWSALLRALGFLGPPLLDGIGRPELTLRYMVVATIVVPRIVPASAREPARRSRSASCRSRSRGRSAIRSRSRCCRTWSSRRSSCRSART